MSRHCRITDCTAPPRPGRRICFKHRTRITRHGDPHHTEWTVADDHDVAVLIREQRPAGGLTRLERVKVGRGLSGLGLPAEEIARILGVTPRTVYRWRAAVRDRMRNHTGTFEPTRHPDVDPDDIPGYLGALRSEYQAVITGQTPPTPLRAITSRDVQEDDIRVMRQQQDLAAFMKQSIAQARQDNDRRRKLVARYPDLNDQMHALPGHAMWSGSVGGNTKTAAIVAEAEQRAATERKAA